MTSTKTSMLVLFPALVVSIWLYMAVMNVNGWVMFAFYMIWIIVGINTCANITITNKEEWLKWLMRSCWIICLITGSVSAWFFWEYYHSKGLFNAGFLKFVPTAADLTKRLGADTQKLLLSIPFGTVLPIVMLYIDLIAPTPNAHIFGKRKRADSDLYGDSDFMPEKSLRKMSDTPGIILGQLNPTDQYRDDKRAANDNFHGPRNPIISYPLEGNALTFAPPRSNKTSLIIANLLATERSGAEGARVIIDPRGETFFVASEYLEYIQRDLVLLDPFGVIANNEAKLGTSKFGTSKFDRFCQTYNPLDFIRQDENFRADLTIILDALITPPATNSDTAKHFNKAARTIIGGFIAWVLYTLPKKNCTLKKVYDLLMLEDETLEDLFIDMKKDKELAGGMPYRAALRCEKVGKNEGGSNFGIFQAVLEFLEHPQIFKQTSSTSFDPALLTKENMDIFVVIPDDLLESMAPWIRFWITIPSAITKRNLPKKNTLIIIDEMPTIGVLKPVTDTYLMSSGSGVSYWGFAQSISILEETWGQGNAKKLIHASEVLQILELPLVDKENAEIISHSMGTVTYESPNTSESASMQGSGGVVSAKSSSQMQAGTGLVRESLVPAGKLLKIDAAEQYILVNSKKYGKNPIHCGKLRYWHRTEFFNMASPNPYQTRKGT